MVNYLEEEIRICQQKVNEYANQPDRHAQDLWYYWYGCLQANRKAMAFLTDRSCVKP